MLTIRVSIDREQFNDETQEFVIDDVDLHLEHSLVSLSKWEQIVKKPFLSEESKSDEEIMLYIECMVLDSVFPPEVFSHLTQAHINAINEYINDKATATWFNEQGVSNRSSETLTNELIYYWMFSNQIPKECETWHLNRLLTLLKIFNLKNSPPKKMSRSAQAEHNRRLNQERKAKLGIPG